MEARVEAAERRPRRGRGLHLLRRARAARRSPAAWPARRPARRRRRRPRRGSRAGRAGRRRSGSPAARAPPSAGPAARSGARTSRRRARAASRRSRPRAGWRAPRAASWARCRGARSARAPPAAARRPRGCRARSPRPGAARSARRAPSRRSAAGSPRGRGPAARAAPHATPPRRGPGGRRAGRRAAARAGARRGRRRRARSGRPRRLVLALDEQADLVADGGAPDVPDAQPRVDGLRERDRAVEAAHRLAREADDLAAVRVEHPGVDEVAVDDGVEVRVVDDVVDVPVDVDVEPAGRDAPEVGVALAALGRGVGHGAKDRPVARPTRLPPSRRWPSSTHTPAGPPTGRRSSRSTASPGTGSATTASPARRCRGTASSPSTCAGTGARRGCRRGTPSSTCRTCSTRSTRTGWSGRPSSGTRSAACWPRTSRGRRRSGWSGSCCSTRRSRSLPEAAAQHADEQRNPPSWASVDEALAARRELRPPQGYADSDADVHAHLAARRRRPLPLPLRPAAAVCAWSEMARPRRVAGRARPPDAAGARGAGRLRLRRRHRRPPRRPRRRLPGRDARHEPHALLGRVRRHGRRPCAASSAHERRLRAPDGRLGEDRPAGHGARGDRARDRARSRRRAWRSASRPCRTASTTGWTRATGCARGGSRCEARGEGWRRSLVLTRDDGGTWTIDAEAEGDVDLPRAGRRPRRARGRRGRRPRPLAADELACPCCATACWRAASATS